ncbi:MAG: hypothetical protein KGY81_08975, partial [Phycisphaerae bacterium]|nr:hypothetical protein [Phycisphaerae bacterium]
LTQHEERLASVRTDMHKELDEKNKQLEQLVLTMQEKDEMIAELRMTVDDLKALLTPGGQEVVNEPDGEIVKTTPSTDTCYINLGGKSNVRQGMSFAVYGRNAEYKEDVKGKIRVVRVGDNISECRIVEASEDNPIAQDDGVANLAFHVNRTYNFVVQGRFDLYGTGQPSEFGRQTIKDAIKRFGGRLSDEVQVQTDYVVMGAEPVKPAKPAPDAPASVQRAYQDQMQQYQEYLDTLNLAQSMKIPVLNGNRFMALTGYLPEQKPQ